jgi:hypothetical protein
MTGPRPAVGRVGKIAGCAVRGGRGEMAALERTRVYELVEITVRGPVAGRGN